jgi:hypothetical protein
MIINKAAMSNLTVDSSQFLQLGAVWFRFVKGYAKVLVGLWAVTYLNAQFILALLSWNEFSASFHLLGPYEICTLMCSVIMPMMYCFGKSGVKQDFWLYIWTASGTSRKPTHLVNLVWGWGGSGNKQRCWAGVPYALTRTEENTLVCFWVAFWCNCLGNDWEGMLELKPVHINIFIRHFCQVCW